MKKTASIFFVILMVMITFTACGKSEEEKQIIGTWRYDGSSYVSVLTFNEDMTCTEIVTSKSSYIDVEITKSGIYEIKKGSLMIFLDGNLEYTAVVRFEDDKMIWANVFGDNVYVRES